MLPRKCKFCERRFVKAEHLKRHQRSHTGEKPYKCAHCSKSFSRSDVLSRHVKAHTQPNAPDTNTNPPNEEEDEEGSSPSEPGSGEAQGQWLAQEYQYQQKETTVQITTDELVLLPPDSRRADGVPEHHPPNMNPYPDVSSLHLQHPAGVSENFSQDGGQQLRWTREEMDMAGLLSQASVSLPTNHMLGISPAAGPMDHWQLEQEGSGLNKRQRTVDGSIHSGGDAYTGQLQNASQSWLSPGGTDFAVPDEFQFWFNQLDRHLQTGPALLLHADQVTRMPDVVEDAPPMHRQLQTPSANLESVGRVIPSERFMRLEQCWPHKSAGRIRIMHSLWHDVCHSRGSNLFDEPSSSPERFPPKSNSHSRRGLDDEVRNILERIFNKPHITLDAHLENGSVTTGRNGSVAGARSETSNQDESGQRTLPDSTKFPPAEILDMGLDLYLRHFHPLYPMLHLPTFSPRTADKCLLHIMCLIGLTLIESRGASRFVHRQFYIIFEMIEAELSQYTLHNKFDTSRVLCSMTTGILVVALAEILGEKIDQTKTQRLYVQIITQSHEQRLFSIGDGQPLDETVFASLQDVELRWKAWSRVESAKRLVTTLLIVDAWKAGTQNTWPILRTDNIQISLPCDGVLFQCKTASKWLELLNRGHQMLMPAASLSSRHVQIPRIGRPMDTLGLKGVLTLIRLRIYEDYSRLLSGISRDAPEAKLVPWQTFSIDAQAQMTPSLVVEAMDAYGDTLSHVNPNSLVLWHHTCIILTTDLRIFERGAGSEGPLNARQALGEIERWTQTTAARRAILHAAQTFKIMSHRRVSDGDPFHLCNSIFHSALVLALYIFMIPPRKDGEEDPSEFELLEDVNWQRVGREGLAFGTDYVDDPAVNFINRGGSISLDGVVHHGGHQSARRILVDFVQLLDDVGKWRAGRYTKILRVMSDALVDDDSFEEFNS